MNDAVDWSADLGGGTRVSLIQAGHFRSDAGAIFGPVPRLLWDKLVTDEIDHDHRILQALNCLLVETPAGRVLIETGIGERLSDKTREMRAYQGKPIVTAMNDAGFDPASVDAVVMSHLHFDHAGGLMRAGDGGRAFPKAKIVAQQAEWEIALSDNSRIVASYDQLELRLVQRWGKAGIVDGDVEVLPGVSVIRTGGHSKGHQAIVVRGASTGARAGTGSGPMGTDGRTLAFFGDLGMRPWSANPRWITSFDDFPLDSVAMKGDLFARAAEEDWLIALSHEPFTPIGRLTPDRDRYRFDSV